MDCDTAIDWASRILGDRLTMDEIGLVWDVIEDKVKVFGSRFSFVGPVLYAEFMVVTRRATFPGGYLGMDPAEIPQFKEGEREKVARKLLEEEGTRFRSCFYFSLLIRCSRSWPFRVCHASRLTITLKVVMYYIIFRQEYNVGGFHRARFRYRVANPEYPLQGPSTAIESRALDVSRGRYY